MKIGDGRLIRIFGILIFLFFSGMCHSLIWNDKNNFWRNMKLIVATVGAQCLKKATSQRHQICIRLKQLPE
jgi:hypothetical protein